MTALAVLKVTLYGVLAMAAYFAMMIAAAALACYLIGWVIGAISVVKQVGWRNLFSRWDVLKAAAIDAHHNGKGLVSEVFGFKRHVIYVPRS